LPPPPLPPAFLNPLLSSPRLDRKCVEREDERGTS
jgi:hypothetical protein